METDLSTEKMMEYLYGLPDQFEDSLKMDFNNIAWYRTDYRNIIVTGQGGSAIGGDILRTYALQQAGVPVIVNRDYNLPGFAGPDSLVLAVSYSGNTEETISSYQQARDRRADIICVTSGGKLSDMARKDGYVVINIPGGLVPRAATGYLFTPLALILERLGYLPGVTADLKETVEVLQTLRESFRPALNIPENRAKMLAADMYGSIPIIWGAAGTSEAAAMRWKAQINENAKSPAYYNVFPELNHNEIVGFEAPGDLLSRLVVIILRDDYDNAQVKKRMDITKSIIQHKVKDIIEVSGYGKSFPARLYSLAYTGDYASVYLALEYGLNPTPVQVIDYLKTELAKNGAEGGPGY